MSKYTLLQGDAIELFKKIEDSSVNCIITDPPYEVISGGTPDNKDVNRPGGILSRNDGKIFRHNDVSIKNWIGECYRVLKDMSHIYIMTNFLNLEEYLLEIQQAGFKLHNLLIWEKNNATPNRWYMKNCEYIVFARKGDAKPINDCGTKTVMKFNSVRDRIHPTEKPVDLLEKLITNSTLPGELVLDPFAGSGSTLHASIISGRRGLGFELDEEYYHLASERLENISLEDINIVEPKPKRLTENQKKILEVLRKFPDKDFSGKELAEITGLSPRTCSGCITPLCSGGYAEKTNSSSPFRIKLKDNSR